MGVNTTLLFGPGDSQECATVSILEDVNVENNETFRLIVGSADQAVMIVQDTAEVTIAEDDDSELYTTTDILRRASTTPNYR